MARKSKPQRPADVARAAAGRDTSSGRGKAVDALMGLLAQKSFEQIGLGDIATAADISLADLRAEFRSTLSILAAHIKDTDRAVLAGGQNDMDGEPPRERLFEVLMRRLDLLAPDREAVRSLLRSAARNPGLALALNGMSVRSQQWMLAAADIGSSGPKGALRAQGAALMFARVLAVWVDDDEEGLDRTMAALDRGLASGERWSGFLDDLCSIPACVGRGARRRRNRDAREEAAA